MIETKFKQTEIGLIPEDWEVKTLGELSYVTSGGTPSTENSSYWGGDIPWMNSGELNLKQVNAVEGRITELGLKQVPALIVANGDRVQKYMNVVGVREFIAQRGAKVNA